MALWHAVLIVEDVVEVDTLSIIVVNDESSKVALKRVKMKMATFTWRRLKKSVEVGRCISQDAVVLVDSGSLQKSELSVIPGVVFVDWGHKSMSELRISNKLKCYKLTRVRH